MLKIGAYYKVQGAYGDVVAGDIVKIISYHEADGVYVCLGFYDQGKLTTVGRQEFIPPDSLSLQPISREALANAARSLSESYQARIVTNEKLIADLCEFDSDEEAEASRFVKALDGITSQRDKLKALAKIIAERNATHESV